MFRKWFTRRKAPPPDDGPGLVCTPGQQIRIGREILLTVRSVTATGAMLRVRSPPHLHLQFPPVDKAPVPDSTPAVPTTEDP